MRSNAAHEAMVPTEASERVPCAGCGDPVDALRAPFVAVIAERYRFYCSRPCRERDRPNPPPAPAVVAPPTQAPRPSLFDATDMLGISRASLPPSVHAAPEMPAPGVETEGPLGAAPRVPSPDPITPALAVGAACLGALLATMTSLPQGAREVLVGAAALGGLVVAGREVLRGPRDGDFMGGAVGCAGAMLVLAAALRPSAAALPAFRDAAVLAAIGPLAAWTARTRRAAGQARMEVFREAIPPTAHVVRRGGDARSVDAATEEQPSAAVKAGAELVVRPGEVVPVDGVVRAGDASVRLWPGARDARQRLPGDSVLAGARVLGGTLRVLTTRAGDAVAWARLAQWMTLPREGPGTVRLARRMTALAPAGVAGLALAMAVLHVLVFGGDPARAAACVLALAPLVRVVTVVQAPYVEALVNAAHRGIVFRDAASVERAAQVGTVAFCFRGTVTVGRPELTEVVSLGSRSDRELLALAAAAEEAAGGDPLASAVLRGAMARGLRLDGVRRPAVLPGLGVTAMSAGGEAIVVGHRRLLLAEGVSVAPAEDLIAGIEGAGRTALLVAVDGRVEGVLGIDDPVRDEARSAVQALIDAGFEVALVAGTGRGTLEAVGALVDVTNLRPEVAPDERAAVVRALSDVGRGVAVVGRPRWDGAALAAADVGIQLEAAGGVGGETAIALASDDLRDAAAALIEAKRARQRSTAVLAMGYAGTVAGLFVAAAVPEYGVLAVVLATVATLGGEALALRAGEAGDAS